MTGCADLKLPTTFWIKRTETGATVGCQSNGRTWRLVCRGTSWLGDVGNCSGDDTLAGARPPTMTSAAYHVSDDVDQTADDFTSSLPSGAALVLPFSGATPDQWLQQYALTGGGLSQAWGQRYEARGSKGQERGMGFL